MDIALEVRLNGEKLYTIGVQDWASLGARISGFRISKAHMENQLKEYPNLADDPGFEPQDHQHLNLTGYAGVSDPDRPGKVSSDSYQSQALSAGDEITIRVIETDDPDKPNQELPPGFCVQVASD